MAAPASPGSGPSAEFQPAIWYLDGYNVLHACLLTERSGRWWGAAGQQRVLAWIDEFARSHMVYVVFDTSRFPAPESPPGYHARIEHAPHADEFLVAQVRAAQEPGQLCVVTADRSLSDRCRAHGCRTMRPWEFEKRRLSGIPVDESVQVGRRVGDAQ